MSLTVVEHPGTLIEYHLKGTISMTIYYLYVKTQTTTGLKYLGQTIKKDPHKYPGSGKRWRSHLDKHGYDYTTEIIKECQTNEELKEWGLYYSDLWNIVDSSDWANLKPESGSGGHNPGARWWNNGVEQSFGKYPPDDTFIPGFNKIWINNSISEMMIFKTEKTPIGFSNGRLQCFGGKQGAHSKGAKWWNNGDLEKMSVYPPGPEWIHGRVAVHEKALIKYNQSPKLCNVCNKPIPYDRRERKSCSISCTTVHRQTIASRARPRSKGTTT